MKLKIAETQNCCLKKALAKERNKKTGLTGSKKLLYKKGIA
jgi:hypothetical protein